MKRPDLIKHVPEYIASMEELINRYKIALKLGISKGYYERKNNLNCLLCNPINVEENYKFFIRKRRTHNEACREIGCPWFVILGMDCDDYSAKINNEFAIYQDEDPKVMRRRIRQLKNWLKLYRNYQEENLE